MYILSLLVQNEKKMECFSSERELIARIGTLSATDKAEKVFSLTYDGELKRHKIVFTERLELAEIIDEVVLPVEEGGSEDGGMVEESQPI